MYIKEGARIELDTPPDDNSAWVHGKLSDHAGYSFSARVGDKPASAIGIPPELQREFDLPASMARQGIEGGRIRKLSVWFNGDEVISFDRGDWDNRPHNDTERAVLAEIVAAFPAPV
jgi:hypothetical protein